MNNDVLVIWYCAGCNAYVSRPIDPDDTVVVCDACETETPRHQTAEPELQ